MEANVGGVGIAMILLILLSDRLREAGKFGTNSANGVMFWSSLYIPVVVAMASSQNVLGALTGGPAAILAGILAVAVCMALVPAISRLGGGKSDQDDWK
jgi:malonate transporter MadL subunit